MSIKIWIQNNIKVPTYNDLAVVLYIDSIQFILDLVEKKKLFIRFVWSINIQQYELLILY